MTAQLGGNHTAITFYLERRKRNLFGQDRKRMMISMLNQALHTHSMKKKAWWALVWYLSNVQAVVLCEVRTVMLRITGTRISGWVLRQNDTMDTTIKNTEITPITWNTKRKRISSVWWTFIGIGPWYSCSFLEKNYERKRLLNARNQGTCLLVGIMTQRQQRIQFPCPTFHISFILSTLPFTHKCEIGIFQQ